METITGKPSGIALLSLQRNLTKARLDTAFQRLLWWVFTGTRGGVNRARVILTIRKEPMNAHRLSQRLHLDYKTVVHHLGVLQKHMILETGEGYGAIYSPSPELEECFPEFLAIRDMMMNVDT